MNRWGSLLAGVVGLAGCVTAPDGTYQPFQLESAIKKAVWNATDSSWAPLATLGAIQTALEYARVAKTPIPYDELAFAYEDVVDAPDEFQRRDRVKAARERIDRAKAQLVGVSSFVIRTKIALEEYDFERGGFATGLESVSFPPLLANIQHMVKAEPYALALANGGEFAFAPVPEEKARKVLKNAGLDRSGVIELEVEPVAVSAVSTILSEKTRVLIVKVLRMRVSTSWGSISEVGTVKVATKAASKGRADKAN